MSFINGDPNNNNKFMPSYMPKQSTILPNPQPYFYSPNTNTTSTLPNDFRPKQHMGATNPNFYAQT